MPDQPADPIHYDMKIPPEARDAKQWAKGSDAEHETSGREHRGSEQVTSESNKIERGGAAPERDRK